MMTTKYYSGTEIQKMEQELWTLTLKGDDIEGYNNHFHELALMFPDLVTPERKKIERYVRGLLEKVKENVTSSKPANLHEAINMAHELVEQAIKLRLQGLKKVTRESGRIIKGTTATTTTIPIIRSKTRDKKLLKPMLPPQLSEKVNLGTNHCTINVICIMTVSALPSAGNAKE
ncbi:hypothetical protein Tco_1534325, partial [Tanacetum coccineum]